MDKKDKEFNEIELAAIEAVYTDRIMQTWLYDGQVESIVRALHRAGYTITMIIGSSGGTSDTGIR